MRDVYIVDGARTPFLKAKGKPGPFSASDLALNAARELFPDHGPHAAHDETGVRHPQGNAAPQNVSGASDGRFLETRCFLVFLQFVRVSLRPFETQGIHGFQILVAFDKGALIN